MDSYYFVLKYFQKTYGGNGVGELKEVLG